MSQKIPLWTGFIGIGATIFLVRPYIAIAKSSVDIGKTAKAITVLITEPNNIGSGVLLQRQGDIYTVLTAAHVVENKASLKITTPDDRSYSVISSSIRSAPGSIDLAVVQFKSTAKYSTAKLGNCNVLKSGMDLYVGGFPGTSRAITQSVFVFREGKVSANSNKTFENGYSLVYSNDTLPGMSGGAVLNGNGELVAIHGRGDRDDSGTKTGFNLGIPINRFATVASKMGVNLDERLASIPQDTAIKVDDYLASAAQKFKQKDYQGTLAELDRAIQLKPNYAYIYALRGALKTTVELQDFPGGLADFDRAIQLKPNYATAYYRRGVLKASKLGDTQGGLVDYNRAIQLNPNYAQAYSKRGYLKLSKRDFQGALADFDRAIALDPSHAVARYGRGVLKYARLKDRSGGIADVQQAAKLFKQKGNLKDYQRAIDLLKKWQPQNRLNET